MTTHHGRPATASTASRNVSSLACSSTTPSMMSCSKFARSEIDSSSTTASNEPSSSRTAISHDAAGRAGRVYCRPPRANSTGQVVSEARGSTATGTSRPLLRCRLQLLGIYHQNRQHFGDDRVGVELALQDHLLQPPVVFLGDEHGEQPVNLEELVHTDLAVGHPLE